MDKFIHIKTTEFLPLPGEEDELVNPGMYGKALAEFIQSELKQLDYDASFVCGEDWGWWVELKGFPIVFGVCIYSGDINVAEMEYAITDGAISSRKWSWKRFGFIETGHHSGKLISDLVEILEKRDRTKIIGISEEMPFEITEEEA